MPQATMKAARLHGIRKLVLEELPVPDPGPGEVLVRVEACGVCATDSRKYEIGVNDGHYPFNPGHEWVGHIEKLGDRVTGWNIGDRVYGDVYGGYAEYALLPVRPTDWSRGVMRVPDDLAIERAILVEPLADCLHAVHDQAKVSAGSSLVVIAAGAMGLKIVMAAARAGVRTLVVEPLEARRDLALQLGAGKAVDTMDWKRVAKEWSGKDGVDAVILTIGNANLVGDCIAACGAGGRVVLFAGFGAQPRGEIDFNDLHYREIALVGSEWVGTPPNQKRDRYDEALNLLVDPTAPFDRFVTSRCTFEDVEAAFVRRQNHDDIKIMFTPQR